MQGTGKGLISCATVLINMTSQLRLAVTKSAVTKSAATFGKEYSQEKAGER